MVRLYLQAIGEGGDGITLKLAGTGSIDQQTGRLTTTFAEDPQLPFEHVKLEMTGGPRATLANPRTCGPALTEADLMPWSTPFTLDSTPSSAFEVTGCPPAQFSPSFTAGTTSNQAGGFSPFTLAFGRSDADGFLDGYQQRMPPGLLGDALLGEPLPRTAGRQGHLRPGKSDRARAGADRPGRRPVPRDGRAGVHHRPVQGRALRPVDRGPGEGGPLHPLRHDRGRHGRGARRDQRRPDHGGFDGHRRPAADDPRRHPVAAAGRERSDRPAGLHVQPDRLQPAVDRGHADQHRRSDRAGLFALPGDQLRGARLQAAPSRSRPRGRPAGRTGRASTRSSPTPRARCTNTRTSPA